jgi:hypothetical protein
MSDLFVLALRAQCAPSVRKALSVPLAHARHHRYAFAEAARRSRLALAATAERAVYASTVALQTPCIEIVLHADDSPRRLKRGSVSVRHSEKDSTCNEERRGDGAK